MSTLVKRILSALVLGPLAIAAAWAGGLWFYAMMVIVFGVSVQEWSRLSVRESRINWGLLIVGILYVGLACFCATWLRAEGRTGFYALVYVFFAVWACDIGAYAAGKTIGGPKLAPKISPNKTWAGLIGGCIATVAVVVGYDAWLGTQPDAPLAASFSPFFHVALGMLLAVVGQLGDLMISILKRKCGLKDTGNIIPGHGGLLDRIDALLLTIPMYAAVIFYLEMLSK